MESLNGALERQARRYLEEQRSLRALDDWLDDHAQPIAESADTELRRLAGRTWNLISERGFGSSEEHRRSCYSRPHDLY